MKFDAKFGAMFKQQRLMEVYRFLCRISATNINSAQYNVQLTTQGGNTTLARSLFLITTQLLGQIMI